MTLAITPDEREILQLVLTRFIEETRSEVHHTDNSSYRERVKQQEKIAKALLEKVSNARPFLQ